MKPSNHSLKVSRIPRKPRFIPRKSLKRPAKRLKRAIKGITGDFKRWTLKRADKEFSMKIRLRDGKCLFPGCTVTDLKKLQASHYIGRARKSVRFDEENVIALCAFHHFYSKEWGFEYQKQRKEVHGWDGRYTLFMKEWLGLSSFEKLIERSNLSVKQEDAIITFQNEQSIKK